MCELTIDEIHAIREENYLRTKDMTDADLLKYTKEQSGSIVKRFRSLQGQKNTKCDS